MPGSTRSHYYFIGSIFYVVRHIITSGMVAVMVVVRYRYGECMGNRLGLWLVIGTVRGTPAYMYGNVWVIKGVAARVRSEIFLNR